jgi:hypothetical protein
MDPALATTGRVDCPQADRPGLSKYHSVYGRNRIAPGIEECHHSSEKSRNGPFQLVAQRRVQLVTAAGCAAQLANTFSRSSDADPGWTVVTHRVCSGSSVGVNASYPSSRSPTRPHLAIAFVRAHPAVTSVLIGPRRPDQLDDLRAGADVRLGDDVLDRIDEIVPPGVDVHTGDLYVDPTPPIQNKRLRRRQDADASNAAEPVTFREPAGHE